MSENVKKANIFNKMVEYMKDVKGELKKVVWPTRKKLIKNTAIVIVAIILVGAFIAALDFGFSWTFKTFVTRPQTEQSTPAPGTEGGAPIDENGNPIQLTPEQMQQMQEQAAQAEGGIPMTDGAAPAGDGHNHTTDGATPPAGGATTNE